MKILFATEFFPDDDTTSFTGGVEARTYFVVKNVKLKHSVKVIRRSKTNINASAISLFDRLLYQCKVFYRVMTENFDVVEASNVTVYVPVVIASLLRGKPRIAWVPDLIGNDWFTHFGVMTGTIGFLQEKISFLFPWTHYIALSRSTEKKLLARGISKERITVIYGGVDIALCTSLVAQKEKHPTVVFAGRLVSYKRVGDLIKATQLIKESIPKIKLKIIGSGPKLDELKQLAMRLGVTESVTFLGFLESHEEVLKEIKSSHLFSLPSEIEGFGLVTVEAMACSVPYVNSDIETTKEVTGNGRGGLLFPVGNSRVLAKNIVTLLTKKNMYKQKVVEGIEWSRQYDWAVITDQTEKVFKKVYEEKI